MVWSDDMLAALTQHWGAGLSISTIAREISAEFDVKISRNAVAGKAHRIGLEPRDMPATIRNFWAGIKARDERKPKQPKASASEPPQLRIVNAADPQPMPALFEPDSNDPGCQYYMGDVNPTRIGRTYGERYDSWSEVPMCRQPRRRDPETGAYTSPYCPHHHDICHTKVREKSEPAQPFICKTPKWREFAA